MEIEGMSDISAAPAAEAPTSRVAAAPHNEATLSRTKKFAKESLPFPALSFAFRRSEGFD